LLRKHIHGSHARRRQRSWRTRLLPQLFGEPSICRLRVAFPSLAQASVSSSFNAMTARWLSEASCHVQRSHCRFLLADVHFRASWGVTYWRFHFGPANKLPPCSLRLSALWRVPGRAFHRRRPTAGLRTVSQPRCGLVARRPWQVFRARAVRKVPGRNFFFYCGRMRMNRLYPISKGLSGVAKRRRPSARRVLRCPTLITRR
jgi:hypothetical protein